MLRVYAVSAMTTRKTMSDTVRPGQFNTPLGVLYALNAYNQLGIPYIHSLTNVKDVNATMSESPSENGDCADPVTQKFQLDVEGFIDTTSVKCPKCKEVTPHQWMQAKVKPMPGEDADPMELLKNSKRILLCQKCGTIRVTN